MKVATVREMQHNLTKILSWVANGEEVQVLRRKKVVARMLPAKPQSAPTQDFVIRAQAIWGKPKGASLSHLLENDRI